MSEDTRMFEIRINKQQLELAEDMYNTDVAELKKWQSKLEEDKQDIERLKAVNAYDENGQRMMVNIMKVHQENIDHYLQSRDYWAAELQKLSEEREQLMKG